MVDYLTQNDLFSDEDEDRNRSLIDGISYSLYYKTGFPKNLGLTFYGMSYSLYQNADLFKEIVANTETLLSEIEEAYEQPMQEKPLVDDTEEETISDEPILPVRELKESESVFPIKTRPNNALYDSYIDAQEEYPNAVVIIRLGDFYEIMGEKRKLFQTNLI